ncbi:MAG: cytochrome c oxidase subunit 3 [Candidatus Dormibacteria bacterium]
MATDAQVMALEPSMVPWKRPSMGMIGMYIFLVSEVMFFGSLFGMYGYVAWSHIFAGQPWPDTATIEFFPVPFLNSIFLFSSAGTCHMAHHSIAHDRRRAFKWWMIATIALGILFLGGQAWEYTHAPIGLGSGKWSQAFFTLTGFHGAHVTGGVTWLIIVLMRGLKGDFNSKRHLGVQATVIYWHFVDLVWVFLLAVLYLPFAFK